MLNVHHDKKQGGVNVGEIHRSSIIRSTDGMK